MLQFQGQSSQLHLSAIFNVISILWVSCRGEISHVFLFATLAAMLMSCQANQTLSRLNYLDNYFC